MDKDKKKLKKMSAGKLTLKIIKILLIIFLVLSFIAGGMLVGVVLSMIKDAPDIDPSRVNASLDLTSTIYDADGNLIEKIQAPEFRTIVKLNQMPKYLRDAFVSIEDERFESHFGVDPKG
ncbi:MAG: transglycosylase domain-containing protein, partial [Tissierellaceae bacterium]